MAPKVRKPIRIKKETKSYKVEFLKEKKFV